MKRLQFSLRSAVVLVALASLPLWLASTALRVWQDPESRTLYVFGQRRDRTTSFSFYGVDAPFWPRYWRRLLLRPWPGTFVYSPEEDWARQYRVRGMKAGPVDLSDEGRTRGRIRDAIVHDIDHSGEFATCPRCRKRDE
jgi:hypothetical protein